MKHLLTLSLLLIILSANSQVTPRPGDGNTPIRVDSTGPAIKDTTGASLINDVNNAYNEMEENIEAAFSKLIQEQKNELTALQEKIKAMDEQIARMKDQADKMRIVVKKMEEIIAQLQSEKEQSIVSIKKQKQQTLMEMRKSLAEKRSTGRSEGQAAKYRIEKARKDSLKFIPLRLNKLIVKAN